MLGGCFACNAPDDLRQIPRAGSLDRHSVRGFAARFTARHPGLTPFALVPLAVHQNIAGIYLIQDGEFAYVNPKMADIFGYEASELLGRPPDVVIAERDQELVAENLEERLSGDTESIRYTFSAKRKDGEEINVEVQGQRIELNGHPAVAGILMEIASPGYQRE